VATEKLLEVDLLWLDYRKAFLDSFTLVQNETSMPRMASGSRLFETEPERFARASDTRFEPLIYFPAGSLAKNIKIGGNLILGGGDSPWFLSNIMMYS